VLQAEAFGLLLLAPNLVHHLQLQQVNFFFGNTILAKETTMHNIIIEALGH
jgi:hypothetical protein